jgi:hypothetical protein
MVALSLPGKKTKTPASVFTKSVWWAGLGW